MPVQPAKGAAPAGPPGSGEAGVSGRRHCAESPGGARAITELDRTDGREEQGGTGSAISRKEKALCDVFNKVCMTNSVCMYDQCDSCVLSLSWLLSTRPGGQAAALPPPDPALGHSVRAGPLLPTLVLRYCTGEQPEQ